MSHPAVHHQINYKQVQFILLHHLKMFLILNETNFY